jgi:adenosylcobyric acid synthase
MTRPGADIPTGTHGGNLRALAARSARAPEELLDFSANINPWGMPAVVEGAWADALGALMHYPDPDCTGFRAAIARHLDVSPDRVLPANGAEQVIWWLPRLLRARRVVVTAPCYLDYRRAASVWGLGVVQVPLSAETGFALEPERILTAAGDGDLVWIGRPNNPTGRMVCAELLADLAARRPGVWWAIDEAFIDFVEGARSMASRAAPNLIVVRSMTKFYALPGLRLGYALLSPGLAADGRALLPDWSVSAPAQLVGEALLDDPEAERFAADSRRMVGRERARLVDGLRRIGLTVFEGAANYLLLRVADDGPDAHALADSLLMGHGIAVRTCGDYAGLDARYLRIAMRTGPENGRLLGAMAVALGHGVAEPTSAPAGGGAA